MNEVLNLRKLIIIIETVCFMTNLCVLCSEHSRPLSNVQVFIQDITYIGLKMWHWKG